VSDYPVRFEADYVEPRNRLTTLLRVFMVLPHYFVLMFWGIAGLVAIVIAWFVLVFTGRWPDGLYAFVASLLRYANRVTGYTLLLTDDYPPFDGGEHPEYPVRLAIDPPLPEYSRIKVLLRIFYVIPAYVIQYALFLLAEIIALVSWCAIVFTGKQPQSLQDLIRLGVSYYSRSTALFVLVTETYPPIADQPQGQIGGAPAGPSLPTG